MREMENEIEYIVMDFNGEIPWIRLPDGTYVVDPSCENKFNSTPIK